MLHPLQPTPFLEPIIHKNVLSVYQCELLIDYFESHPGEVEFGKIGQDDLNHNPDAQHDVRSVSVIRPLQFMKCEQDPEVCDILQSIRGNIIDIGMQQFGFDLDDVPEIEIAQYIVGGHYKWHVDTSNIVQSRTRKLSFSLFLNDPDEYDGGELLINVGGSDPSEKIKGKDGEEVDPYITVPQEQGTIVVFPSFIPHKVCPVTNGERFQLFGWAHGPRFK
jgi:PKHD-type hydroxylase